MVLCGFFFLFSMEPSSDFQQNSEPTRVTLVRAFFFSSPFCKRVANIVCLLCQPPPPSSSHSFRYKTTSSPPFPKSSSLFHFSFFLFFSTSIHY
ncbi:hypothetical protein MGE_06105 [Candida albicans P75010]|nr:hypothetical protein MGE_06105 [Candida albicans P75010]